MNCPCCNHVIDPNDPAHRGLVINRRIHLRARMHELVRAYMKVGESMMRKRQIAIMKGTPYTPKAGAEDTANAIQAKIKKIAVELKELGEWEEELLAAKKNREKHP